MYFRRADLVVLPYREIDQSGVLATALAFGVPLRLTAVGGFPEVAAGRARSSSPATRPRSRPSCSAVGRPPCRRRAWPPWLGSRSTTPMTDVIARRHVEL